VNVLTRIYTLLNRRWLFLFPIQVCPKTFSRAYEAPVGGSFMNIPVSITVNGVQHSQDVEPRMLLVHFLRDVLGLTGTNIGCDTSQCGACTVHLDGMSVKSCTVLAVQADGGNVTTIEGLAQNGKLHPMQQAFWDYHGLQCGYCTPGMIMAAVKLVENNPNITEQEIRHGLEGNFCRCTGYENIIKSVSAAAGSGD
jgi:aerobic carbon-monoxide dehydrogenase small subunit